MLTGNIPKAERTGRRQEPRIAKSSPAQVRFTEVGPGEHGSIELGAAHVGFAQTGVPQKRLGRKSARRSPSPLRSAGGMLDELEVMVRADGSRRR
jgi:hypothetical protein